MQSVRSVAACFFSAFLLSFLFVAGQISLAQTLDQSNAPTWSGAATNITPPNKVSQQFVPSLPCLIAVETALKTGNTGRGGDQVMLQILNAAGQLLIWTPANLSEGYEGFYRFTLPTALVVPTGQPLTIRLQDSGKNVFWWKYNPGNPYPAGQAYFYGSPFSNNDFLFKTYGAATCPSIAMSVTPNPFTLTQGGSQAATINLTRLGGFAGPVTISFSQMPSGVSASAVTPFTGNSASTTFSATAAAPTGQFFPLVSGVGSGVYASTTVHVIVAAAPAPHINSVSPTVQQKGGTVTLSGANFSTSCASDVVTIGGTTATPSICTATSLTVQVPQAAVYGAGQISVSSNGHASNGVTFSVARQFGAFVEITGDVVSQRSARSCSTGAVKMDLCTPNCSGYVAGNYVAQFRKAATNTAIDGAVLFHANNARVANLGGIGYSLCNVGIALDADTSAVSAQLMAFKFVDLDTGVNWANFPFNWGTPDGKASYSPRLFRSPDGTIIMALAPANVGNAELTAGFMDKVQSGKSLGQVPIYQVSGAVSASVTANNQISFTFGTAPAVTLNIQ